jgi:hypothetical protein
VAICQWQTPLGKQSAESISIDTQSTYFSITQTEMKKYHIFFLLLKIAILIQYGLILVNRQTMNSRIYILTEILFKTALFVFIEVFMFHIVTDCLSLEDRIIISFAGGLLFFDAWFNDFPKLKEQIRERGLTPSTDLDSTQGIQK